jgi:hypothetical protein
LLAGWAVPSRLSVAVIVEDDMNSEFLGFPACHADWRGIVLLIVKRRFVDHLFLKGDDFFQFATFSSRRGGGNASPRREIAVFSLRASGRRMEAEKGCQAKAWRYKIRKIGKMKQATRHVEGGRYGGSAGSWDGGEGGGIAGSGYGGGLEDVHGGDSGGGAACGDPGAGGAEGVGGADAAGAAGGDGAVSAVAGGTAGGSD